MDDVTPKLLDQIKKTFQNQLNKSDLIAKLYAKVRDGTATYKEANEFALEVGKILAKAFESNLSSDALPDGKMYYNIAKRIIEPTMENNYSLITDVTNQIQKTLNDAAGIGIKPIAPTLNEDRIEGIINRVSSEEVFDDIKWILKEPIVVFSQSIVDDAIRENAEFQYKAGLNPKIIRKSTGKCCKWCESLAGSYNYPDVPEDVYRRHDHCRCKVDYIAGKVKKNVHNNNVGRRRYIQDEYGDYELTKEARISRAKQMEATERERKVAAREKRIETWRKKKEKGYFGNDIVRIGNNEVDMTYIHSEEYKKKFDHISENNVLNDALYKNAVKLLSQNKNSDTEGVFIINSQNGKTILNKRGEKDALGVGLTDRDLRIIRNQSSIVGIHNHPTNLPPNGSDLTAAGYRKYDFGIIVTHDGRVFKYSVGNKPFVTQALDARIDKYKGKDYNLSVEDAYIKALNEFRKEYNISWLEVESENT